MSHLTPRETQIVQAICTGADSKRIARDLGMADKTLRNHASQICIKLGVGNRVGLVLWAVRSGMLDDIGPRERERNEERSA